MLSSSLKMQDWVVQIGISSPWNRVNAIELNDPGRWGD
jgi:hypothetical protein